MAADPNKAFFAALNAETDQRIAAMRELAVHASTYWKTLVEEGVPKGTATVLTYQFQRSVLWRPSEPPTNDGDTTKKKPPGRNLEGASEPYGPTGDESPV